MLRFEDIEFSRKHVEVAVKVTIAEDRLDILSVFTFVFSPQRVVLEAGELYRLLFLIIIQQLPFASPA